MNSRQIKRLAKEFRIDSSAIDHSRILTDAEAALENSRMPQSSQIRVPSRYRLPRLVWAGGLAAAFLIVASWLACFVLFREVADLRDELELARRDVTAGLADETATINLYLKEHRDVAARHASLSRAAAQQVQLDVSQHDILYYEFFDDGPEYMRPGIIVRGPSSRQEIISLQAPAISNGHTLTLSEARETAAFDLVSPPWLNPGYMLEQIRRIEGRDALHLMYTDGINTLSLFEQPLDGRRGLDPQDFREYAVYRNKGQVGGTILAWRDGALSYVLIGNTEMPQLMDMAQLISARK